MTHAVDYVIEVMKKISSTEPQMFQRDGSLYVVSEAGFGQITYGLGVIPEEFQSWQNKEQGPGILNSEDVKTEKGVKKAEKKYLAPICFGEDDRAFSLKSMAKTAEELAKVVDDGKIRMARHGSNYHSHKHGYASDGIDVYLTHARKMNIIQYLDLVRKQEESLVKAMDDFAGCDIDSPSVSNNYQGLQMPLCVLVTPHILVSLPLKGELDPHRMGLPTAWKTNTKFHQNDGYGSILTHERIDTYEESPFGLHIKTNSIELKADEIDKASELVLSPLEKELNAVRDSKELIAGLLDGLNSAHKKACAKDIKWKKELRKKQRKKKRA